MTQTGGTGGRRLGKAAVERLLVAYESDPVGALTEALQVVTGCDGDFASLVDACAFDPARRLALLAFDPQALDRLLVDLNELRTLPH